MATDEPDTGPLPAQRPQQPTPQQQPQQQPPVGPPPSVPDPDQLRQFEEFRQFQQFQEFQRYAQTDEGRRALESGGAVGFPLQPPGRRPPWQRFLRGKAFRKLVYALVVVLVVVWGYNHYFGATEDNDPQGSAGPGSVQEPGRLSPSPQQAVIALYKLVAQGGATEACTLVFDHQGGVAFAQDYGEPTCEAAITKVAAQVTGEDRNSYATPKIDDDALVVTGSSAVVDSCKLNVRGGPELGKLLLSGDDAGWVISGHEAQTCPAPSSGETTTTATG